MSALLQGVMPAAMALAALALAAGLLLLLAQRRLPPQRETLVERINTLLPQTQCAQCGYPGCRPYAEAIARGAAATDLCPPGGEETVHALATLLGEESGPCTGADIAPPTPRVARVREADCIGCGFCLDACPVDAIVGTRGLMHTVIAAECTGCDLCLPPCPVDCIEMHPLSHPVQPS